MRYFFLAYALLAVLVVGAFGVRGQKFSHTPIELFPDMDRQDKVKAQKPSAFFADGVGSRLPVAHSTPSHLAEEKPAGHEGPVDIEFGTGRVGYYFTGKFEDGRFGAGFPEELELTEENVAAFLRRGQERFGIYCSRCHGDYGNGMGIAHKLGVPAPANLLGNEDFYSAKYAEGQIFDVIGNGKGQMKPLGFNIPVRDRWAIVAYVRALQTSYSLSDQEKQAILDAKEGK